MKGMINMKQEHKDNTIVEACPCKNNYDRETFFESFAKDDEELKKCNSCPNFSYDCGIASCLKFC